ncbi:M48 family metallopeptidase [Sphingosinicella terrae]|uniref:M48 family metallopeptidase n=1 Tax=Sphingosinicella terrae TaxID=2172047 RepID=UPI000E0CCA25|nr:M48 family metallopeptidase [Sphingosinicella terrae]
MRLLNRLAVGLILPLLSFGFAPAAAAERDLEPSLLAMRTLDARLTAIGHRLATANLALCPDRQWLPGFALHDLSQYGGAYREAATRAFGLAGGTAVLAVVPGGPAENAGLQADDALVSVDGAVLPRFDPGPSGSFDGMERILAAVEAAFADGRGRLRIRRGDRDLELDIAAEPGCASRFQLIPSSRMNALADGRYVQLTTAIAAYAEDDAELAAIAAHELAHNILRHRARLDAAGVARGLLRGFGRNARLIRETEAEADRMSVYLLDRAGYDVEAPVRFWERFGRRGLNFLGSPTHGHWRGRVARFEAEIEIVRRARAAGAMAEPPSFAASAAAGH